MEDGYRMLLLGPLQVEQAGVPVRGFESRKAVALLCYLAVQDQPVSRAFLADMFWGDKPEARGRGNLSRVLHNLSHLLPGCWQADRQTVRFQCSEDLRLDVNDFNELVAENKVDALARAMKLYRGDFMAGFYLDDCPEFETWLVVEREHRRQQVVQVLQKLIRHHTQSREYERGLYFAARLLDIDPWREEAHRQSMFLLALSGQRSAALAQYQNCCRILAAELGVEPAEATTSLYKRIRDEALRGGTGAQPPGNLSPLMHPEARPHNLPAQITAFIGRAAALAAVQAELSNPEVRLLTLTGPGGTGKTRLGLQVAANMLDDFADGVFLVVLAPVRDPDLVGSAIAKTLGIRQTARRPVVELLKERLRDRQMLLVLDNFEHILPAAPLVTDLLSAVPKLKVLVTSRASLRVYGEWDYPVLPLSLPKPDQLPPPEGLAEYEAIQLFIERARAIKSDFRLTTDNGRAIAEICLRLDGLPLAIELAAARLRLLTPQNILVQMGHRLELLVGGPTDAPARQQTLRSTIDWSYNLLDVQEKDLFQRLAVFGGGCTLEAAEAICNISQNLNVLNALESLADKNLIVQSEVADEPRFGMLETIREYALERLIDSGAVETSRQRHAYFFLELGEASGRYMYGPKEAIWVKRLEVEHDNLRAALAWSIENAADIALRLAGSLGRFWHLHAHHSEGRRWLVKSLTKSEDHTTELAGFRARALNQAGVLSHFMGDTAQAYSFSVESVKIWRQVGDKQGLADALCDLGVATQWQNSLAKARALLEESICLFRELKDKRGLVRSLFWRGHITYRQQDYAGARTSAEESITLAQEIGDTSSLAAATSTLGRIAFQQDDFSAAQLYFEKSLHLFQETEDKPGAAIVLDCLGNLAYAQDDYEKAKTCIEESSVIWRELGSQPDVAWLLCHMGYIDLHQGDQHRALIFFRESLALNRALEDQQGIARCLAGLAGIAAAAGQSARATQLFGATEVLLETLGTQLGYIKKDMCDRIATTIQADYERTMAAARAKIPKDDYEAAYAEGQAMSLEQAITYAGQKEVSEE